MWLVSHDNNRPFTFASTRVTAVIAVQNRQIFMGGKDTSTKDKHERKIYVLLLPSVAVCIVSGCDVI